MLLKLFSNLIGATLKYTCFTVHTTILCLDGWYFPCIILTTVNSEMFLYNVKRHICQVKNSQQGHDLPLSVNDRVISQGLYFHETSHMFVKIKPLRNFSNLQGLRDFAPFKFYIYIMV